MTNLWTFFCVNWLLTGHAVWEMKTVLKRLRKTSKSGWIKGYLMPKKEIRNYILLNEILRHLKYQFWNYELINCGTPISQPFLDIRIWQGYSTWVGQLHIYLYVKIMIRNVWTLKQAISYQTFTFIVSCDSVIDFLSNSYFIVEIHHAKSFKMKYSMSLYLNFSLEYS